MHTDLQFSLFICTGIKLGASRCVCLNLLLSQDGRNVHMSWWKSHWMDCYRGLFCSGGKTKFKLADGAVASGTVPGRTWLPHLGAQCSILQRLFAHSVCVSFRHNDVSWLTSHLLTIISSWSDDVVPSSSIVPSRTVPNAVHIASSKSRLPTDSLHGAQPFFTS